MAKPFDLLPEGFSHIKRMRSHSAHAQFLATVEEDTVGFIPQQPTIPSPYAYSQEWPVYRTDSGKLVIIRETSHRCFDVFEVPASLVHAQ